MRKHRVRHVRIGCRGLVADSQRKLSGAVKRESVAAASAFNQSEALNNRRLKESPQDRLRRAMEQSLEIERQQLEYQKKIAYAIKPRQPVKIG
jgi:hypothetical protein